MLTLPKEKNKPLNTNPRFLILFGKPKCGKTTLLSQLDDCLIVDLEGGSLFLEALAVQARSVNDFKEIADAIREEIKATGKKPYKYIAIDNASRLEEICLPYAAAVYRQQPFGKNWKGTDVRLLEKGAGWHYIREAIKKVINMFRELCDTCILVAHTKDKDINVEGENMTELSLNLAGALADIIAGEADAIGYVYRKKNETIISFKGGENSIKEARSEHLRGNTITVATSDENNKVTVDWSKVFLP